MRAGSASKLTLLSDTSDNIGAILAVADWLNRSEPVNSRPEGSPPLTMLTVLLALVKAYEIQGVLQLRNAFNARGIDHVILVKIASTAVVS